MLRYLSSLIIRIQTTLIVAILLSACSHPILTETSKIQTSGSIVVLIDTDGDHIPDKDAMKAGTTRFARTDFHGIVLHNTDDDDADKRLDDNDDIINGDKDVLDLFPLRIETTGLSDEELITLSIESAPIGSVGVFHKQSDGRFIALTDADDMTFSVASLKNASTLFIEGKEFASEQWDGLFYASFKSASLPPVVLNLRVAPWLMLSNASEAERLFIREHIGLNDKMIKQLKNALARANTDLQVIPADAPYPIENIWLQDTLEIGRQYTPFRTMPVVLQANRNKGIDNFSKDGLLGPDFGWMRVGDYREKYARGEDGVGWLDWFGNLEISPPLPSHPHGRMYYGRAGTEQLDPRIVSKIAAQQLQTPFSIDVSYLMIKHADETLSWVPGKDGRWYALVPSPKALLTLAKTIQQNGHGELPMLAPFEEEFNINTFLADEEAIAHNIKIEQGPLAANIETVKRKLGLNDDQFIEVPAWIKANGTSLIPNMVNSVVVNGLFIAPEPHGPKVDGIDLIEQDFRNRLAKANIDLKIVFVDDQQYHRWWGNVHCATNVTRKGDEHIAPLLEM